MKKTFDTLKIFLFIGAILLAIFVNPWWLLLFFIVKNWEKVFTNGPTFFLNVVFIALGVILAIIFSPWWLFLVVVDFYINFS